MSALSQNRWTVACPRFHPQFCRNGVSICQKWHFEDFDWSSAKKNLVGGRGLYNISRNIY